MQSQSYLAPDDGTYAIGTSVLLHISQVGTYYAGAR